MHWKKIDTVASVLKNFQFFYLMHQKDNSDNNAKLVLNYNVAELKRNRLVKKVSVLRCWYKSFIVTFTCKTLTKN